MIAANKNPDLKRFREYQAAIRNLLMFAGRHIKQAYSIYESNFQPHITIGRYLSANDFAVAWEQIESYDCQAICECTVDSLTLSFVEAENEHEIDGTHVKYLYPFLG